MARKGKNISTVGEKMAVEEEVEYVSERGTWSPEDTDRFHQVLSKYTFFEANKLILDHRYLDPKDITTVEKIEAEIKAAKLANVPSKTDKDIVDALEQANEANTGKNCYKNFCLLRELQAAAGGKHSVRQINTKHINTRSRWSIPFQSLHEVGYLIKNQNSKGLKRSDTNKSAMSLYQRTNIEKKNLAAIKAILKFVTNRNIFWDDQTNSMPALASPANSTSISSSNSTTEEMAEPERWIRAMIKRHGYQMVTFMEQCVVNLANSYIAELQERGMIPMNQSMFSLAASRNDLATTISHLVDEVVCLPKPTRKTKSSASANELPSVSSPPLDTIISTPAQVTQTFFDGDAKSLGLFRSSNLSAASQMGKDAGNDGHQNYNSFFSANSQNEQPDSFMQLSNKETSPEQDFQPPHDSSYNGNKNGQAFSFGSQVKRSQSLLFSDSQLNHSSMASSAAQAQQQQQPQYSYQNQQILSQPVTSTHPDLANYDLSSYTGLPAAFAGSLFQGSSNQNGYMKTSNADDGYLSSFVNFDNSMTVPVTSNALPSSFKNEDFPVFTDPFSNSRPILSGTPQSDLLEAIVNLSVNTMQPNGNVHHAFNGLNDNSVSNDSGTPSLDQTPIKMQRLFNDQKPNGFPQRRHSQMSAYEYHLPHKLSSPINIHAGNPHVIGRTHSDEQSAASSSMGWMPDESQTLTNTENQSMSSAQQQAFTFQLPYSWSEESNIAESFPKTPAMPAATIPFGTLQTSFSTSSLSQIPMSIDTSNNSGHTARNNRLAGRRASQRRASARPALGTMPRNGSQEPPDTATNSESNSATGVKPNVSSIPISISGNGQSKTTTNLIMVNGIPSHIELTHDNSDVNPNPIVLPISQVIQRDN
ncbi:hypothetical protein H4R99_002063 [Coemansia sp. RSA 1722]|nr:hypothetical protein LPJ57_000825 [Coemansia sp. RSA 486]KAJ2232756.1 hypothetical protein IWW45_004723 [Coemansia sp. RSA 485]KAJ2604045.1 hypothetical protein H4R99_002063 [Coemansia sp. RSA 1722]